MVQSRVLDIVMHASFKVSKSGFRGKDSNQ